MKSKKLKPARQQTQDVDTDILDYYEQAAENVDERLASSDRKYISLPYRNALIHKEVNRLRDLAKAENSKK